MGMTVKEAILTLNANAVFACERAGLSSAAVKMIEDALDTIEDALKAQKPVEPTWRLGVPFCSKCGRQFKRGYKYCPDCGRAVNWG